MPQAQVLVYHPVYQPVGGIVHAAGGVRNHALLELALYFVAAHQVAYARCFYCLVEERFAPFTQLVDDILYLRDASRELALHVIFVHLKLRLNILYGAEIFGQHREPLLRDLLVLFRYAPRDAQRREEL